MIFLIRIYIYILRTKTHKHTCLMVCDMLCVLGLRREKLRTIMQLVTISVVVHMTKIKYLK